MDKSRSLALDGLRGIAIIIVIFSHLPLTSSNLFFNSFLLSGKIGVCILFLLTGFLMAWIYPAPRFFDFISRRYARLFPAFLVMVISWSLIKFFHPAWYWQLALVVFVAFLARLLWNLCLRLHLNLTGFWLTAQIVSALWYCLYLLKIPSPVFYQTWLPSSQQFVTALINGTLTLPFGNYIGQLDGVYWSLITEVYFYLLYPLIFVPIFYFVNRQSSLVWKTILFLAAIPFCWSLYFIAQKILGFSITIPYLAIYFIAGVALGSNLSWFQSLVKRLPKVFFSLPTLLLLFVLIFLSSLTYDFLPLFYHPLPSLFLVFPLSFLVISLTLENNSWNRLLSSGSLTFFGKYSYSLYITHALAISLSHQISSSTFIVSLLSFIFSLFLSLILFELIEKPYYLLPKTKVTFIKPVFNSAFIVYLCSFILALIYIAYRPPLSLFTSVISYPATTSSILITPDKPFSTNFIASRPNLGMITAHVLNLDKSGLSPSTLSIKLFDNHQNLISHSSYSPYEIIENHYHSFGFPIQASSAGQSYTLQFELVPPTSHGQMELVTTESNFNTVYFFDKKFLITQPSQFISWFFSKLTEPFHNRMFWFNFLLISPLLFLLTLPSYFQHRSSHHTR